MKAMVQEDLDSTDLISVDLDSVETGDCNIRRDSSLGPPFTYRPNFHHMH